MRAATDVRVLFVALGASRRRTVCEESAQIVSDGGVAVVLVDRANAWRRTVFAPTVAVIEMARLESRHLPLRLARGLLYRAPSICLRLIGHGPLRRAARQWANVHQRLANRIYERLVLPGHRRIWPHRRPRLVEREVLTGEPFDLLVIGDPESIPDGAAIVARLFRRGMPLPVSFGLDAVVPAARAPADSACGTGLAP